MSAIPVIILLVLCVLAIPVVAGIWLVVRVTELRSRIGQLSRRLDTLEIEAALLRRGRGHETAPGTKTAESPSMPPVAPPQPAAEYAELTIPPPQAIPPEPVLPPEPIIPPMPDYGVAEAQDSPAVAAPPKIPITPPIPPEPVFASAQVPEGSGSATQAPPLPEKASFEMRLGTFWLVRIGIVMLLTGLAFFANYAYHHIIGKLGPGGKIGLLYCASGLLLSAGAWWQRRNVKESLKNYGQVLFAGGLAAVYFTTYAAHHIPALQVIHSALLDGTLLLAWAGVIMWLADRRKSEVMALFAVGLAFYSSVITRVEEFTLYSNLILTLAAVFFLVRNRWAGLSFASLGTSYAGYTFWRFLHADGWRWATPDENLWLGAGFLASYWLVFTAAAFLSKSEKLTGPTRAAFLTLNNGALFTLFLLTMIQVHTGGFWKFSLGYGTVLLVLAGLAQKVLPNESSARNSYLTQGLLLVTLGFIFRFSGLQLSLVLGAESVALFVLGSQRAGIVLKCFAWVAALLATGWCVANLRRFDSPGLWTAAGLGGLLAFEAFWAHRLDFGRNRQLLRAEPSCFTLLAFACWLAATWWNSAAANLPLVLASEAVVLTFSIYLLRVREIAVLGQSFLLLAQAAWLSQFPASAPPWWNPLMIIAITIGLSHWWQYQKRVEINRQVFAAYSAVFALAAVAVAIIWLQPMLSVPAWLALSSLLAIAVTGYGLVTRAWPLAICGQIFLLASAWEFFRLLFGVKPGWYFPLAPVLALLVLSFATVRWFARKPDAAARVREPLLQIALVYRWFAVMMSLLWVWEYVPERQRAWSFMLAAAAIFALALLRRNHEALAVMAVYAGASLITLWMHDGLAMDIYIPNLLSLLALVAIQQILRRAPATLALDDKAHGAVVFITDASLWRFLSCWMAAFTGGFFATMAWAGFAVVIFGAGMLLRERFHRWFGLAVLAAAIGRVVLVDVWKQETIYRVLTFMALGVALLVVGFIYNKYQEKIRLWL